MVDGTPTDCVLLAVKRLLRDRPPDLVLSGINGGSNVGEDLTYSGTVAAAMEATLLGIPAMALSQDYHDGEEPPWQTGEAYGPEVIRRLLHLPWPEHTLFNINSPGVMPREVSGCAVTHQGKRAIADNLTRGQPRGPLCWIGRCAAGSRDAIAALATTRCRSASISISPTSVLNALRNVE
jgi:5'-nucleotidase